jgi:hypothetical protein
MNRTLKGFPGLYREDNGPEGTRFRIVISREKTLFQEFFYFRGQSAERKARASAIARWHQINLAFPPMTKRRFREIIRRPTGTGIAGVTRIVTKVKNGEYDFWKATWTTLKGKRISRQFSVNKYGKRNARKLAIAARQEALDAMGDS